MMLQQPLRQQLADSLAQKRDQQLLRSLAPRAAGAFGANAVNFSSNDYLGLSQHPAVIAAYQQGLQEWGVGAGASPLVTGYTEVHAELAANLAAWFGVERVLLFSSGYSANAGVLHTLREAGAIPIIDKLCHASIYDGVQSLLFRQTTRRKTVNSGRYSRFKHNDYADLQRQIALLGGENSGEDHGVHWSEESGEESSQHKGAAEQALIVSEGLFSMDGDGADIASLSQIKRDHNALLMIDDAHGIGVMGSHYRGVFDAHQAADIDMVTGTFGKAFGMGGAFIATDHLIADALINECRHLIYSTAFGPAQAYALNTALTIVQTGQLQTQLQLRITEFRQLAQQQGLRINEQAAGSPIQPILIGANELALRLSAELRKHGFQAIAIRPPTVPRGTARIRFTLSALHSAEQIQQLFTVLAMILAADKELADACTIR